MGAHLLNHGAQISGKSLKTQFRCLNDGKTYLGKSIRYRSRSFVSILLANILVSLLVV